MISNDIQASEEILILDGDFKIIESDNQHLMAILQAGKGNFIADPTIGVEIYKFQNAPVTDRVVEQLIRENLKKDNYSINRLKVSNQYNELLIDLNATKIK